MTLNAVHDTQAKLSDIMVDIGRWMNRKLLKLNENKSKRLIIGKRIDFSRYDVHHFQVNGRAMCVSDELRDLGYSWTVIYLLRVKFNARYAW